MLYLVTGAGGFLGRFLVEMLLARGAKVRAFGRRNYPELLQLGSEVAIGDIRHQQDVADACRGVDVVFHAAALAGIWGSWDDYYQTNVVGTRNVLRGCREQGVGRLIYTSSPSVTFTGADQAGVDESAPYARRWLAHYPRSKALAEAEVLAANNGTNFLTCALRPHLIWGPRDQHLVPRLIARARAGQLRCVGDRSNLIDMIYVENAALAHVQAAEALMPGSRVAGRSYFLSQGEPVNCWAWIDQLLALVDLPSVRRSVPVSAAYGIGAVCEAAHRLLGRHDEPRMTRFLALQLGRDHYFDISAARNDFGYAPTVSTEEGMRRLGEWLRQPDEWHG